MNAKIQNENFEVEIGEANISVIINGKTLFMSFETLKKLMMIGKPGNFFTNHYYLDDILRKK